MQLAAEQSAVIEERTLRQLLGHKVQGLTWRPTWPHMLRCGDRAGALPQELVMSRRDCNQLMLPTALLAGTGLLEIPTMQRGHDPPHDALPHGGATQHAGAPPGSGRRWCRRPGSAGRPARACWRPGLRPGPGGSRCGCHRAGSAPCAPAPRRASGTSKSVRGPACWCCWPCSAAWFTSLHVQTSTLGRVLWYFLKAGDELAMPDVYLEATSQL